MPSEMPTVWLESFGRGDHNRSFAFRGCKSEIAVYDPVAVRGALLEVERATERGLHAAGFVIYEAASGLDPALSVRSGNDDLPLLWFGLFETREEICPEDSLDRIPERDLAWEPSLTRSDYEKDLSAIRSYIAAGDTYQVNHTFRMSADLEGDVWAFTEHYAGRRRQIIARMSIREGIAFCPLRRNCFSLSKRAG